LEDETPSRGSWMSKTRRMHRAFAAHLRPIGRADPRETHPRVVRVIDTAPWHPGAAVEAAGAENPDMGFQGVPRSGPQWSPIERLWKKRRGATHNRRFDTVADRKSSVRASRSYFQTVRQTVRSIIDGRPKRKAAG
jgi:hypothetical protein